MGYAVEVTSEVKNRIRDQVHYIAVTREAPLNAQRWLRRVLTAIESLAEFPSRHVLAPENAWKAYDVRRLVVQSHVILFTIDENRRKVWVIGFHHGGSLPQPDTLPDAAPE